MSPSLNLWERNLSTNIIQWLVVGGQWPWIRAQDQDQGTVGSTLAVSRLPLPRLRAVGGLTHIYRRRVTGPLLICRRSAGDKIVGCLQADKRHRTAAETGPGHPRRNRPHGPRRTRPSRSRRRWKPRNRRGGSRGSGPSTSPARQVAASHGLYCAERPLILGNHVPGAAAGSLVQLRRPTLELRRRHVAQGAYPKNRAAASHCARRSL